MRWIADFWRYYDQVCGLSERTWHRDTGEVIANSCNDAMMQIGAKMGATQFIKAQSLFNFGTRTGIDLPNEGAGIIHTKDSMGKQNLHVLLLDRVLPVP